jgi:lipoate-protein ligase A
LSWVLERRSGSVAHHHAREVDAGDVGRRVELLVFDRPALVLGSAQSADVADEGALAATGTALVRRRSGGGAVLLVPDRCTWIDVTIGRTDPLWHDDVATAFHWLGHAWCRALADLGTSATVHVGPMVTTTWSPLVCFAGLGAGELVVDDRKLVGMSQRRTRAGARFQCVLHRTWDPVPLLDLLVLDRRARDDAVDELAGVATGLDVDAERLAAALVASLPD